MREPIPYCFYKRQAVEQTFLDYIGDFIQNFDHKFQNNAAGDHRRLYRFDATSHGYEALNALKDSLAEYFEIGEYLLPPRLKDFIGYVTEGGVVHQHVDKDAFGLQHVRINVLVTKTLGCIPVIEDIPIAVSIGDAWLNLASKCRHGTTAAVGPGHRSVLSFGYQIDPIIGARLHEKHTYWHAIACEAELG